ncbi:hypothetical protein [Marinomonas shanghaiensis]|uniref:hypothetical protein n=1 Tax=Marinomonas shanghaiensis TaxID=2202418 RepID=UPI000DBA6538|nr:hypothetical protein [Marinomonas shanghaiensis]
MDNSVVLNALRFYRDKVQKDFDKLDAVFSARPGQELVDVLKEAQEIIFKENWFESHGERIKELADKEKQLKAVIRKQLDIKAGDKRTALRIELDEIAREIVKQEHLYLQWRRERG